MNHKTDMHEALQLCIDAMLHDGVPTDLYHPRRVALAAAEAALAGQSAGVPDGWKLVPIEPTPEMVKAGSTSGGLGMDFHEWMGRINLAWRHMLAAAPAPVSAPYPATLCEDGGKCGIGGYCGQCEKVRAASDPEQPSERGEHNFESDKPIPIVTYDDGTCVMLDSWTGGAHEAGVFGEIALRFTDAHGVETVREYVARTSEQPNAHGERPIEPEDIDAVAEAIQRETSVEWLIASRAAVAAIDTLIARGNHASERVEQECPHGVDDGACKQCYGEAVSGEQGTALLHAAADECMSPDQRNLFDSLGAHDADVYGRLFRCVAKRIDASAPTLSGGAAPWQGCKHRVCYKNGACWTAGKCLEPTEPEPWPTEIDAQIKACALMILGICATRPQDEWPKRIEGRIRYMLSRLQPQAAEPSEPSSSCDPGDICAGCRCKYNTYGKQKLDAVDVRVATIQSLMLKWINSTPGSPAKSVWTRIEEHLVALASAPQPQAAEPKEYGGCCEDCKWSAISGGGLCDGCAQAAEPKGLTDWREKCAALVDIYDDAKNNEPENRCYVDGAFRQEIDELRALLAKGN